MNKNTFAVSKNASGRRYIYQTNGESDKNHWINDGSFETSGERRIYETNRKEDKFILRFNFINMMCKINLI